LLELADSGQHASSDYVEDALTSGVTTIGCMRVGGGLAGATVMSNMQAAARIANDRDEDLVILEGSGASIPEVEAATGIVVVPAHMGSGVLDYLNPYRLLLADLAVVTMAEEAPAAAATTAAILGSVPELDIIHVVFRPEPLADVNGRKVFFCTTAPKRAGSVLQAHLEESHGCDVVGMSHRLADRKALKAELERAPEHDLLLIELKAAAVDVAARAAAERGTDVVFVNNELVGSGVGDAFDRVIELASERSKS
jgi:cyclic 2,3-diphosphoglycerate synthetase